MAEELSRSRTVLVLGGKPLGSCEIVQFVHSQGDKAIVADYLPLEQSPAKRIADDHWEVSTADVESLAALCRESGVDAIMTGVHEFNISKAIDLCKELGLPFYCGEEQFALCLDKGRFKELCRCWGLRVARAYSVDEALALGMDAYPLAVKPLDGSGSRGFSKCEEPASLVDAVAIAKDASKAGEVLIEEYIDADAVIVHYTAHEGEIIFSGIADKSSLRIGANGAPIMALQIAPSIHQDAWISQCDSQMRDALSQAGMKNGPIWVEAFFLDGEFIMNEIGYRFGGSLTYHLVEGLSGIDQLQLLYAHACGMETTRPLASLSNDSIYGVWPIHVHAGHIASIQGADEVLSDSAVTAFVLLHHAGDDIEEWGSAQQVLAYVHLHAKDIRSLLGAMRRIGKALRVEDSEGHNLLFALFDPNDPIHEGSSSFLRYRLASEASR